MEARLVYTPAYDISLLGLEKLYRFDTRKHSRAWAELGRSHGARRDERWSPPDRPVDDEDLLRVHTRAYLDSLDNAGVLARALETRFVHLLPSFVVRKRILLPMRWATQGTILAGELALDHGIAVNLAGGYHHAKADRGEGFCVFADVAVSIARLRATGRLGPEDDVLILDLDVHQGNGVSALLGDDPHVHILDVFNIQIYPRDQEACDRVDCTVPVKTGLGTEAYLIGVRQHVPDFVRSVGNARLAIYNAGTDIVEGDPLGCLRVSPDGVFERDRCVFDTLAEAGIPWVMVPSGGYTKSSYRLIARSVGYVLDRW